ncbi:hypothetical protein GCM10008944_27420 [Cytobacillus oceanisediminis]
MLTAIGAAKATAYAPSPSRSRATSGITVMTASDSKATRNARAKSPTVVRPKGPVHSATGFPVGALPTPAPIAMP